MTEPTKDQPGVMKASVYSTIQQEIDKLKDIVPPDANPELNEADLKILNRIKELEETNKKQASKIALYESLKTVPDQPKKVERDPIEEVMKELEKKGWK